jgi:hypothetical protein
MALIEFIGPAGERVERLTRHDTRTIKVRGRLYQRAPVQSFAVRTLRDVDQKDQVLTGYYREECQKGSRFRSKFSKAQIKRAWEKPQKD